MSKRALSCIRQHLNDELMSIKAKWLYPFHQIICQLLGLLHRHEASEFGPQIWCSPQHISCCPSHCQMAKITLDPIIGSY